MADDITTEKIQLTIRRWYYQRKIDYGLIKELGLNYRNWETQLFEILEDYDAFGVRHIYRAATYEELIAKYPKNWWQHFKERWFPKFLLEQFPVLYTKIIAVHKFPHWEKDLGKEYVHIELDAWAGQSQHLNSTLPFKGGEDEEA